MVATNLTQHLGTGEVVGVFFATPGKGNVPKKDKMSEHRAVGWQRVLEARENIGNVPKVVKSKEPTGRMGGD